MAYRMFEISSTVRVGKMGDGALNIEVWSSPRGWITGDGECEEIVVPADSVEALFDFIR